MEKILKRTLRYGKFIKVSTIRSKTMQAIRGKNNKTTERKLRSALMRNGLKGWRLHPAGMVGCPDVFFPKTKLIIFVDGCFWHGCHDCGHIPKTRSKYWKTKIERNQLRDRRINRILKQRGFEVKRFWEHSLKSENQIIKIIKKIKPLK